MDMLDGGSGSIDDSGNLMDMLGGEPKVEPLKQEPPAFNKPVDNAPPFDIALTPEQQSEYLKYEKDSGGEGAITMMVTKYPELGGAGAKAITEDVPSPKSITLDTPSPSKEQLVVDRKPNEFYSKMIPYSGLNKSFHSAAMRSMGIAPKPPGGYDEMLNPLDATGNRYSDDVITNNRNIVTDSIAETFHSLGTLATHPYEVVKGLAEFGLAIPGFLTGVVNGGAKAGEEIIRQVTGKSNYEGLGDFALTSVPKIIDSVNLLKVYDAASKGMEEGMQFYQPVIETIVGKPTETSQMVGQIAMAPMTLLSMVGGKVASADMFKDSPNIQGAARFLGDLAGIVMLGSLMHKGAKQEVFKSAEDIVQRADKLLKVVEESGNIPSDVLQKAHDKAMEVQKLQLELEAKRLAKKISEEVLINEDLIRLEREVEMARLRPSGDEPAPKTIPLETPPIDSKKIKQTVELKTTGEAIEFGKSATKEQVVELDNIYKKGLEKYKQLKSEGKLEEAGQVAQSNQFYREASEVAKGTKLGKKLLEAQEKKAGEKVGLISEPTIEESKPGVKKRKKIVDVPKEESKATEVPKPDPITVLDEQLGETNPKLTPTNSPFFQSEPKAMMTGILYDERGARIANNPDTYVSKLINDVNRWFYGEEIDIAAVRKKLNDLAVDNMRDAGNKDGTKWFETGEDYLRWKEHVKEADQWASGLDRKKIERTDGTTLVSGPFPVDEMIKNVKKITEYMRKARAAKKFNKGEAYTKTKESLVRALVDRSGNVKQAFIDQLGNTGYNIVKNFVLSKGATAISALKLEMARRKIYSGLTAHEKIVFDTLTLTQRMVAIGKYKSAKQFKFPDGLEPANSALYGELFQHIEKLTDVQTTKIKQRVDLYFEEMRKVNKDLFDAGLISEKELTDLNSHNYRRLKLIDLYDRRYGAKIGGSKKTIYDSGIEALARGRNTDVFEPSSEVMMLEVFNRAYGRIMNNAANKTLHELAIAEPGNPFARYKYSKEEVAAAKEAGTPLTQNKIPTGWQRVFLYDKGERKQIYISPEVSKEWMNNTPQMTYKLGQVVRWASGSPILRTMATGIDFGFAMANIVRDVNHIWYASRVFENGAWKPLYSNHLPVYGLQIGRDVLSVASDALLRGKRYQDYINEGGGMEFLVHQGRLFQRGRHIDSSLDGLNRFLGYLGETSEITSRLAIRERAIRRRASQEGITIEEARGRKDIVTDATMAARDYMDFAQGGDVAKAMDNVFPYLNAGIQGSRGMLRALAKDNPKITMYKLAQFGLLATGIYIAGRKLAPKTSRDLEGDIATTNNICIPMGDQFSFIDDKGEERFIYYKIPLDPSQKFFKVFFEEASNKWLGYDVDHGRVAKSLAAQSPVSVSQLPPTISGALGYVTNKDFWSNEDIWRGTPKPLDWPDSRHETIPLRTPSVYEDIGKVTGMSPERTKYAVEELVTGNSMWVYLMNQGYEKTLGDIPQSMKQQHWAEAYSKYPISNRFIGITNPYKKYGKTISEAEQKVMLKNHVENSGLDALVEGYLYHDTAKQKDVFDYLRKFKDPDTYDRLLQRYQDEQAIKHLANKTFWRKLKGLPIEAKAMVYQREFDKAGPEEKAKLRRELGQVLDAGGFVGGDFFEEIGKYKSEQRK